jgi:hypothetical protein
MIMTPIATTTTMLHIIPRKRRKTTPQATSKDNRACSRCSSNKTRLYTWGRTVSPDGYPQWYRDGQGGWLCYYCYMHRHYAEVRRLEQAEFDRCFGQ